MPVYRRPLEQCAGAERTAVQRRPVDVAVRGEHHASLRVIAPGTKDIHERAHAGRRVVLEDRPVAAWATARARSVEHVIGGLDNAALAGSPGCRRLEHELAGGEI